MRALFHYLLMIVIALLPLQGSAFAVLPGDSQQAMEHRISMATQAMGESVDLAVASSADSCHENAVFPKPSGAHAKCNASANCCVGAVAPPSTVGHLSSQFSSIDAQTAREPAMTVFIPPALERPPRLSC